jgi:hypothetical protein
VTLGQIIAKAAERYRTDRSSLNQGAAVCDIQRQLFVELGMLKTQYKTFTDVTIANQASYDLPTDCRIENVWSVQLEQSVGGEYEKYDYAPLGQENVYGNYYTRGSASDEYMLFKDGAAIETSGLKISIVYYERAVNFDGSDLSVSPALDEDFHDYFWMKLVEDNASCGDYPDFVVANAWGDRVDAYKERIRAALLDRFSAASPMTMQVEEYF